MPASSSKRLDFLKDELQRKSSKVPLEFQTIPELFNEGVFVGVQSFFNNQVVSQDNTRPLEEQDSVQTEVSSLLAKKTKNKQLLSQISSEELGDVLLKMRTVLTLPPGQLDRESELYLEQQLSEVLGFEVSNNLENHRLTYNTGKIKALPHLKRHPTDTLKNHTQQSYATMSKKRGSFGWFLDQGTVNENTKQLEKYYVALQLFYLKEWSSEYKNLKKWYRHRKMILINPFNSIAVVCAVGTIGPTIPIRYQFGASPETIVEGKFWSTQSNGRAIVLFVDDPKDEVPLGPINLTLQSKDSK